jgi:branched-chain amino acid transport system substrate-binding protein
MNKKIILFSIISILLIAFIGFSFTGYLTLKENDQKIKIGIMTPLTGPSAFLGENIVKSAELAIKELGYEDKVILIIEDSGQLSSGNNTLNSYNKLVNIDKVDIILDGMLSDGTMSIASLLEKDKVVMITPLTGGKNIDNASEYLFRNGPSDIIAGTRPAKEIYFDFGYKQVVLFTENAEYTLDISKNFKNSYKGEIVLDQIILSGRKDYRTEVSKLINKDFDAIVINSQDGISSGYIIKELKELGINKPIFGNFLTYTQNTIDIAGEQSLEGLYIYDPEFSENEQLTIDFLEKYKEEHNTESPIKFHTTGTYDAIKVFLEATENVGYDGERIRDYLLKNIQDWQGMNGVVSFDENGNTKTGFVLKQVKNGKLAFP